MIRVICTAVFCLILFGALPHSSVSAQRPRYDVPTTGPYDPAEQLRKGQEQDALNSIRYGPDGSGRGIGPVDYSRYGARNIKATEALIEKQEKAMQLSKAERAAHEQFLKQPHAGLVRLLPAKTGKVVSVEKLTREGPTTHVFPGGGAFYSFTKLNHMSDMWADLKLLDGEFEVAFGPEVLGALTMLGDVPLDSLTIESKGVSALAKYAPPSHFKGAKSEQERFKSGVSLDSFLFKTTFPVQENMTYALRSIAYQRSDVLVAFRVLKQEDNGSVLLLWKRLEKFSTPKLKAEAKK